MADLPQMGTVYRINSPRVIAETVGEETIVVNLASGHYFNLQGTAVEVWSCVERHESVEKLAGRLENRYSAAAGEIAGAVAVFLQKLVDAGLIVADEGAPTDEAADQPEAVNGERTPFVAPMFTCFTDMQDIILLDPVHEVDETGWPQTSAAS